LIAETHSNSRPSRFTRFAAIDWSGAKGTHHAGIAVGVCMGGIAAPKLVTSETKHWSRRAILDWVLAQKGDIIIGFDFSFAPPFVERSAYFPGDDTPQTAKAFWAYVDLYCDGPDLGAASLLEHRHRRHFYFGAKDGRKADYTHFRACEAHYNANGGGKPSTIYEAIGAAQVAKASFSGMRLLAQVDGQIPIWPFDPLPPSGPVIVEIYTQIAARAAGLRKGLSKIRTPELLDAALISLGSAPHTSLPCLTDHATDALVTAAWLRTFAVHKSLWSPRPLTEQIAQSEGWTFGIT
jgi:hypothetical protein